MKDWVIHVRTKRLKNSQLNSRPWENKNGHPVRKRPKFNIENNCLPKSLRVHDFSLIQRSFSCFGPTSPESPFSCQCTLDSMVSNKYLIEEKSELTNTDKVRQPTQEQIKDMASQTIYGIIIFYPAHRDIAFCSCGHHKI